MTLHRLFLNTTFLTSVPYVAGDIHADPVTASIIAYTGVTATSMAGIAIAVAVNLAMAIATSALMSMLAEKPEQRSGITTESPTTGEDQPVRFVLGKTAVGGQFVDSFRHYSTTAKYRNHWLAQTALLSDLPIEGIERVVINDNVYNLIDHNQTHHGRSPELGKSADGNMFGNAFVRWHDGRQTEADAILVDIFKNHHRPWTTDHILTGSAYAISSFWHDDRLFNAIPTVRYEVKGARLFDPRLDSTVGGNGPQRFNDSTTHTYTENPVVMIYNLVRGIRIPPSHVYGLNASADSFRMARWFAAMNACDQIIDGEPRYRAGLEVSTDQEPLTIIQYLLDSCGGQLCEYGGIYDIQVGGAGLPVAHITDEDILIDRAQSESIFKGIQDSYNTIKATSPNPDRGYEVEGAVPYTRINWIAEDDGIELVADLKLPAVTNSRQVNRLMREAGADHRRRRTHSISLPPSYLHIRPLDTISWTSPDKAYSAKLFEVQGVIVDPLTLSVELQLRERDPKDYDLDAVADAVRPIQPPKADNTIPDVIGVEGFTVTAHTIEDDNGKARRPAIKVTWDDNGYTAVQYRIRIKGKSAISLSGRIDDLSLQEACIVDGILPDTEYEISFKAHAPQENAKFGEWYSVKTLPIKLGFIDMDPTVVIEFDAAKENARLTDLARQQAEAARDAANTIFGQTDAIKVGAEAAKDASLAGQKASELARDESRADRLLSEAAANRASLSEGISVQASKDGQTTVMLSLPATFADGGNSWTQDLVGNPVTTTPIVSDSRFGFSSNAQEGPYIYILGSGIDSIYVLTRGVIPVQPGQTFRIDARTTSNGNINRRKMLPVFVLLDGSYDLIEERRYSGRAYSSQMAFGDQVAEFTIPADSPARFLRYGIVCDNALSSSNGYISLCRGTDVSSELAAGLAASAAANSATMADAKATEAGAFANAARVESLAANTHASDARSWSIQSANSASSANVASSQAQAAQGLAVQARDVAQGHANTANTHARASLASAQDASAYANSAGQFASAARADSLAANTYASDALIYRNESLAARNTANGHAVAANTNAGISVSARDAAQLAANTAAGHSNTAQRHATAAANSATSATASVTKASEYADASLSSSLSANTSRGQALTFRNESANSATIAKEFANAAAGSAAIANTNAGIAVSAKNDSQNAASSSLTSSQSAAASANLSAQHSTASQNAAIIANTASQNAKSEAQAAARDAASASASKTGAEQAATASRNSATTASTEAGKASASQQAAARSESNSKGSEQAAAASANLSAQARDTSMQNAIRGLPSTFENLDFWTRETNRSPEMVNPVDSSVWDVRDDTDGGQGRYVNGSSQGKTVIMQKGVVPYVQGRTYRLTLTARIRGGGTVEPTFTRFRISAMNGDYGNAGDAVRNVEISTGPTWNIYTLDYTFGNASPSWARFGIEMNGGDGPSKSLNILRFQVEDITAIKESEQWASASSSSASAAKGSADTASSQAQAATQARNDANSHRASAQTSRNEAAQASTDAAGSAAQALTHMENASRLTGGGVSTNPVFSQWTGSMPTGYTGSSGSGNITKISNSSARYTNAIRCQTSSGTNEANPLVYLDSHRHNGPTNPAMVRVRLEFSRVNGALYRTRLVGRWTGNNTKYATVYLATEVGTPHPEQNVVQTVEAIMERPADFSAGSSPSFSIYYANSEAGEGSSTDVILHRFDFEEVNASSVAALTMATKATVEGQSSLIAMRTKAGGASAGLEIVSLSNPNGSASSIRMNADEIIMNGTIKNAKIENAAITTLKLGDNSVTVPVGATGPTVEQTGSGTYAQLVRITVNLPEAGPILYFWSIQHGYFSGGFGRYGIRVEVNGQTATEKTDNNLALDWPSGQGTVNGNKGNNVIRLMWRGWDANRFQATGSLSAIGAMR